MVKTLTAVFIKNLVKISSGPLLTEFELIFYCSLITPSTPKLTLHICGNTFFHNSKFCAYSFVSEDMLELVI